MQTWLGLAPVGRRVQDSAVADRASEDTVDFDAVFRRYAPYVGAIVARLVGRADDVDDIVQDVFFQAHRGLHTLRDPEAVRPWLTRIAVRRSRRWLRRHWHVRFFASDTADDFDNLADPSASPEQRAEISRIYRELRKMPADQRVVWVLRTVEGETLESIATLVGCSLSTVQRRLRAAQAMMERLR